jgi:hypothetical protein
MQHKDSLMRRYGFLLSTWITLALATGATAQERTVNLAFPAGSTGTTVTETLTGEEMVLYRVGAEAGQTMAVTLETSNPAAYFNVYEPGRGPGDNAFVIGQLTNPLNAWRDVLPTSGEYTVAVYLIRAAARRGESAEITLDVFVTGDTPPVVQNDFADGLAGGPDLFEVALSSGGTLNMRSEPTTGGAIVTRLSDGETLRNLGCRMAEGRRWCRVATLSEPPLEGWTAGDFLIEASGTAEPATD